MNIVTSMRFVALAELIAQCWARAEEALRNAIRSDFPDRDEEIITDLFHSKLRQNWSQEPADANSPELK